MAKQDKTKYVDGVELIELELKNFFVPKPSEFVLIRSYVLFDRVWYDLLNRLIKEGYEPSETICMGFSSLTGFIDMAVREKLERIFADKTGLGKLYQKHLQKDFRLTHYHIEKLNDELWEEPNGLLVRKD